MADNDNFDDLDDRNSIISDDDIEIDVTVKAVDDDEDVEVLDNTTLVHTDVNAELAKSFYDYAMAVNVSRAIPDARDGLKPVHRRILYAMGDLGLYNDKPYRKSATIVGEVMGKYHPHGDSSIYDALVRLAQNFSTNSLLVDGQGNFGSVDGDPAAAMRYTESRLSKISAEMLRDIDKNTVDFVANFDGSRTQPSVLPARFPNLLVNGSDGIAVGMATNIPPHNLAEVIDTTIAFIDNNDITFDEIMQLMPAPDFPTHGIIMGRSGIRKAYETGRGAFTIRARAEIEEYKNGTRQRIIVTEIPYQINKSRLIVQIADLVKAKRLEGISDLRDESDRTGMRIVIELRSDANAQVVLNSLYKQTQMQISFSTIFLCLVGGTPKVINIKDYLSNYVTYQKEVIVRRTEFDLDKAKARAHILEGLVIAQANIDEVIAIIKKSADKPDAAAQLMATFELSEVQVNAILEMRLQSLTNLQVEKLKADLAEVHALIEELISILQSEQKVLDIIKADLSEIKAKNGVPRKSEISLAFGDIDDEDLIEEQPVVISLSHEGYVKRMPVKEYRSQNRGGRGVVGMKTKEEDFVRDIFVTSTHDTLLCFSTKGRVYRIKGYHVPEASKTAKGRAMVNLLQIEQDEYITSIIPIKKEAEGFLIMATRQGLIKKTKLSEFDSIRKSGKIAIKLNDDDTLISVYLTNGEDEIIIATSSGKCIRFNERNVRAVGRDSQGVRSVALTTDEHVVDMSRVDNDKLMLTISEFGYGKRSSPEDYRLQSRAGKGIKAGVFNEVTGGLVNLKQVSETDDIMMIADNGVIIRTPASKVSVIGRNTKGVRVMRLADGAKIVSIAVVPSEETEEELAESLENIATEDTPTTAEYKEINAEQSAEHNENIAEKQFDKTIDIEDSYTNTSLSNGSNSAMLSHSSEQFSEESVGHDDLPQNEHYTEDGFIKAVALGPEPLTSEDIELMDKQQGVILPQRVSAPTNTSAESVGDVAPDIPLD